MRWQMTKFGKCYGAGEFRIDSLWRIKSSVSTWPTPSSPWPTPPPLSALTFSSDNLLLFVLFPSWKRVTHPGFPWSSWPLILLFCLINTFMFCCLFLPPLTPECLLLGSLLTTPPQSFSHTPPVSGSALFCASYQMKPWMARVLSPPFMLPATSSCCDTRSTGFQGLQGLLYLSMPLYVLTFSAYLSATCANVHPVCRTLSWQSQIIFALPSLCTHSAI